MSAEELESNHDYIQWLFPSFARSNANPGAPILDAETAAQLRRDQPLRRQLRRSFDVMLHFHGLQSRIAGQTVVVERGQKFKERAEVWLLPRNHNFLRLTRILKCLTILSAGALSRALLDSLEEIVLDHPGIVSERTLRYWRDAVPK